MQSNFVAADAVPAPKHTYQVDIDGIGMVVELRETRVIYDR